MTMEEKFYQICIGVPVEVTLMDDHQAHIVYYANALAQVPQDATWDDKLARVVTQCQEHINMMEG